MLNWLELIVLEFPLAHPFMGPSLKFKPAKYSKQKGKSVTPKNSWKWPNI